MVRTYNDQTWEENPSMASVASVFKPNPNSSRFLSFRQVIEAGRWKNEYINDFAIGLNPDFPFWILNTAREAYEVVPRIYELIREEQESQRRDVEDGYLDESDVQDFSALYDEVIGVEAERFAEVNTRKIPYIESSYYWVCGGCYLFQLSGNSDADIDFRRVEYSTDGEFSEWHNDVFTPHLYDFAFNMVFSMAEVWREEN